jgi:hypothetical protein
MNQNELLIQNTAVHDQFSLADFMSADKQLILGQWNLMGSYQVGITEMIKLGYALGNLESSVGRVRGALLKADDTVLKGKWKVTVSDISGTTLVPRWFESTSDLMNQGLTDMTKRIPMTASGIRVRRERVINLYFEPETADLVNYAKSDLLMSITRYSL